MLKKTILQFKTRQNLKKRVDQPNADFKSSKKIAVIYSDQFEKEENLTELVSGLKREGKQISILVYCHNHMKINTSLPHFTLKDISLSGKINNDNLQSFIKQSYDFALCLDESHHYLIDYVFSLLNAKCRVGFMQPSRNNLFEMMVHTENPETALSNEFLRYLKMIQSV